METHGTLVLTINKEKVDLLVAAKQSYEYAKGRAIRALAVLCAAENGKFNDVIAVRSENGNDGCYKFLDSEKCVILKVTGLKGEPQPKRIVRGAVVNQRVLQPWAEEQIPEKVRKNLASGFAGALAAAIGSGPSETPDKPSPVKAEKTLSDVETKRLQAKYDADFYRKQREAQDKLSSVRTRGKPKFDRGQHKVTTKPKKAPKKLSKAASGPRPGREGQK